MTQASGEHRLPSIACRLFVLVPSFGPSQRVQRCVRFNLRQICEGSTLTSAHRLVCRFAVLGAFQRRSVRTPVGVVALALVVKWLGGDFSNSRKGKSKNTSS